MRSLFLVFGCCLRRSLLQLKEYDLVAISQDISATHKETKQPILLRKVQIGIVVLDSEGEAFLLDLANEQ